MRTGELATVIEVTCAFLVTIAAHGLLAVILRVTRPRLHWLTRFWATLVPPLVSFMLTAALLMIRFGAQVEDERNPEFGLFGCVASILLAVVNLAIALIVSPLLLKRFARVEVSSP